MTDRTLLESIRKHEIDPLLKSWTLRTIEYFQAFDLDIHRVLGSRNMVADALSRYCVDSNNVSCLEMDPVFQTRIAQEYENDALFRNVMKCLR